MSQNGPLILQLPAANKGLDQKDLKEKLEILSITVSLVTLFIIGVLKIVSYLNVNGEIVVKSEKRLRIEYTDDQICLHQLFHFSNLGSGKGFITGIDAKILDVTSGNVVAEFYSIGFVELAITGDSTIEREIVFKQKDENAIVSLSSNTGYILELCYHVENESIFENNLVNRFESLCFGILDRQNDKQRKHKTLANLEVNLRALKN